MKILELRRARSSSNVSENFILPGVGKVYMTKSDRLTIRDWNAPSNPSETMITDITDIMLLMHSAELIKDDGINVPFLIPEELERYLGAEK